MLKIGVKVPNLDAMKTLKKEILFFDKIVIDEDLYLKNIRSLELMSEVAGIDLSKQISYWNANLKYLERNNAIEFLNYKDFLNETKKTITTDQLSIIKKSQQFNKGLSEIKHSLDDLYDLMQNGDKSRSIEDFYRTFDLVLNNQFKNEQLRTQHYSELANLVSEKKTFTPIYFEFPRQFKKEEKKTYDAVSFILKKIPLPSNQTSFERLLDFKKNEDSMLKLQRLRIFTNELKITPENYKFKEEEFIYLLDC